MLSLKVMFVLVFILLSINDATIAHTSTTHDQAVEQKVGVDEAGNGIIGKLRIKEVYDGLHYVQVIGRGRKEMEGYKMTKEDYKNSVATKWEIRKMRRLQRKSSNEKVNSRASLMDFDDADYSMPTTHPPRHN